MKSISLVSKITFKLSNYRKNRLGSFWNTRFGFWRGAPVHRARIRTLQYKNLHKLFIWSHTPGECSPMMYFTFSIADVPVLSTCEPPRTYRSSKSSRKINDLVIIVDFSMLSEMLTVFPDDKSACYRDSETEKIF